MDIASYLNTLKDTDIMRRIIESYTFIAYGQVVRVTELENGSKYCSVEATTMTRGEQNIYNNVEVLNLGFAGLSISLDIEFGDSVLLLSGKNPPIDTATWSRGIVGDYSPESIKCLPLTRLGRAVGALTLDSGGSIIYARGTTSTNSALQERVSRTDGTDYMIKRTDDGKIRTAVSNTADGTTHVELFDGRVMMDVNSGALVDSTSADKTLFSLVAKSFSNSSVKRLEIVDDSDGMMVVNVKSLDGTKTLLSLTLNNDATGSMAVNNGTTKFDWTEAGKLKFTGDLEVTGNFSAAGGNLTAAV